MSTLGFILSNLFRVFKLYNVHVLILEALFSMNYIYMIMWINLGSY